MGLLTNSQDPDLSCLEGIKLQQYRDFFNVKILDNHTIRCDKSNPYNDNYWTTLGIHKKFFKICQNFGIDTIKCFSFCPVVFDNDNTITHITPFDFKGMVMECEELNWWFLNIIEHTTKLKAKNLNIKVNQVYNIAGLDIVDNGSIKIDSNSIILKDEQFNEWINKTGPDIIRLYNPKTIMFGRNMPNAKRLMKKKIEHVSNLHESLLNQPGVDRDIIAHHHNASNMFYLSRNEHNGRLITTDDRGFKLYLSPYNYKYHI